MGKGLKKTGEGGQTRKRDGSKRRKSFGEKEKEKKTWDDDGDAPCKSANGVAQVPACTQTSGVVGAELGLSWTESRSCNCVALH